MQGAPVAAVADAEIPPLVGGLLAGRLALPRPAGIPQKFLIFALHPESARHILLAFSAAGIPHARLAGKRGEKNAAVAAFRDPAGIHVLVATTSRDSAGLHLPETSTLVFYNHHHSAEVTKQAIGRAQRVGRTHSLEVVEIVSEGEAARLIPRPAV